MNRQTALRLQRKSRKTKQFNARTKNAIGNAEYKLILERLYGLQRRFGIRTEVNDGVLMVIDTKSNTPFVVFNIDDLEWDSENPEKNGDIVRALLSEQSPLKILRIYYRQIESKRTDLQDYYDESVKYALQNDVHDELWENDLSAAIEMIEEERVQHYRVGVISPWFYDTEKLDGVLLNNVDELLFCLLNGFWNRGLWQDHKNKTSSFFPHGMKHEAWPVTLQGSLRDVRAGVKFLSPFGESNMSSLIIEGLGLARYEGLVTLRKPSFFDDLLPSVLEQPGDSAVLVENYFMPKPSLFGQGVQLEVEKYKIFPNFNEDALDTNNGEETESKSNFFNGFSAGILSTKQWGDSLVNAGFKLYIQSQDEKRAKELTEKVADRLNNNAIYFTLSSNRETQQSLYRSILPIIKPDEIKEHTTPWPLRLTRLEPEMKVKIPEGRLKILIGHTLLGEPYFIPFGDNFCIIAGQQSGKTAMLQIYMLRAIGLLPKSSVFVYYDGTDVLEDMSENVDYGPAAIARWSNRGLDTTNLSSRIKDTNGVMYGQRYSDPKHVITDFEDLVNGGVKTLVFSSLSSVHARWGTEFALIDAYGNFMRSPLPGMLAVDEIAPMTKDNLADKVFREKSQYFSKRNKVMAWTAQTSTVLKETEEEKLRSIAYANTYYRFVGRTHLIDKAPEEAGIDTKLYPERALRLNEILSNITLQNTVGIFVAVAAGGKLMETIKVDIASDASLALIQRKSEEDRIRYGL